jgi:hypothetical protein
MSLSYEEEDTCHMGGGYLCCFAATRVAGHYRDLVGGHGMDRMCVSKCTRVLTLVSVCQ